MVEINGGQRHLMTSIYYLLTKDSPIGHFHLNQSDIVHYYHLGSPIQYSLIFPDGTLNTVVMGSDVIAGQCLQLHVPGGVWKANEWFSGIRFDQ
jgi:predicted cupin superfamily sugar epimerase